MPGKGATMNDERIIPPGMVGLPPMDAGDVHHSKQAPKRNPKSASTGNRFGVLNAFIDFTAGTLSRAESLTWLVLYRDTKANGTTRTAQSDIARRIGADARTVNRAIRRLHAVGLVRIVWQGGFRRGPSVYAVLPMPKAREKPT